MELKRCTKCGGEFPATLEFFGWQKQRKLFVSICKTCRNASLRLKRLTALTEKEKFAINLSLQNKKQCKKCGGEFPATVEFFRRQKDIKSGMRAQCKKCLSISGKIYTIANKNNRNEYARTHKEKISKRKRAYRQIKKKLIAIQKKQYRNSLVTYNNLLFQNLIWFNKTRKNSNGYGEITCAYCGKWIIPTNSQVSSHVSAINNTENNNMNRIYCSKECKQACPTYGKTENYLIKNAKIAAGLIEDPWYTSSEYKTWRDTVLKIDNHKCVWCEKPATIVHHVLPQKTHPELSLDPTNGLSCCHSCHMEYGHRDKECKTGILANLVCGIKKRKSQKAE